MSNAETFLIQHPRKSGTLEVVAADELTRLRAENEELSVKNQGALDLAVEEHTRAEKLDWQVNTLRAENEAQRDSRGMFVARLEKTQEQGNQWLTVTAVLAILNDCDMLAARTALRKKPQWLKEAP